MTSLQNSKRTGHSTEFQKKSRQNEMLFAMRSLNVNKENFTNFFIMFWQVRKLAFVEFSVQYKTS